MSPRHHPDDATLVSYAAGALSQVLAVVTAAHLERCAECRARLRQAEEIGGVLMQQHTSSVVPLKGRSAMLARLDERQTGAEPAMYSTPAANQDPDLLPVCMHAHFGRQLSTLKWKTLVPGVQRVRAQGIEQGNLMLLKIAPGVSMPVHSHESGEMTMVLKGAYHDIQGSFALNDVADLDSHIQHQPIAYPDRECICVLATESRLRFHGLLARMMQPFFGI
ncbi:ChrR family anti-sigma-E factor [Pseudomonas ficuserectae]|uniref:Transcriptional activator ChrR n=2 Tax=Pseudomonas amygdali pv. lachrymans TaxID=53707 RepID=A0AB37RDS0_PSEAV|nr:ChrR family anti-sigma-E factor [Pseudomonas amygdali]ARA79500.1 transcriptional regulator [Pseudomonas amygdali pv. lachrymans]AXH57857.1 transcriptional regulator [Pseudomonas amygdali pv. lachrymans str. M301315]KKY56208.1 transcriptional regulator [Pseudomonas amygdali pv. lachrymans]KPB99402.1 Transcriptional activator ChrR [Pseudomonas amygdali pv. lachrymans]KPC15747.1 Transcriptional activator ChrR [Pseudomonas amygdali pv. lachrymans]